jgi:hypothetical protein
LLGADTDRLAGEIEPTEASAGVVGTATIMTATAAAITAIVV